MGTGSSPRLPYLIECRLAQRRCREVRHHWPIRMQAFFVHEGVRDGARRPNRWLVLILLLKRNKVQATQPRPVTDRRSVLMCVAAAQHPTFTYLHAVISADVASGESSTNAPQSVWDLGGWARYEAAWSLCCAIASRRQEGHSTSREGLSSTAGVPRSTGRDWPQEPSATDGAHLHARSG